MTATTDAPDACEGPAMPPAPAHDYAILRWLVLATFVVILNETIMLAAIPRLMADFEVPARTAQWLSTAFMLTMAVVIPVTGWFLQRVTTRVAFGSAMTVFCAGTLVAGLAPVFPVLLAGRVVQAAGTAVMLPLLMTTLMSVVPEHDRGRVMGNVTLAISVAPALGPTTSGIVLEAMSWRWMFGIVLPVAVGISVIGLRRLTNHGVRQDGAVDWLSVAAAAVGFGGLVYGLSQLGAESAAVSPYAVLALGSVAIGLFVVRQLLLQRSDRPLLDLRTLTHRTYAMSLVLMSVAFMAMLGSMILLTLYLQDVRGLSVLQAGLAVMPGGLLMGLMGPQIGRWFDRVGGRPLVIPGSVGITASLALFTFLGSSTSVWLVMLVHILLMVSLALLFTPVFTLGLGALPPQLYSHGSSLLGTLQQVGGAVGTAVVVAVMAWRSSGLVDGGMDPVEATVGGMRWAFGVSAAVSVAVLLLAFRLPGRPPQDPQTEAVADVVPEQA